MPPRGEIAVGRTDDPQEREADRVAEHVLQTSGQVGGGARGSAARPARPRQAPTTAGERLAPPIVHVALQSPGAPLDASTRAFFEPRLGSDLSGVRVHRDAAAAASARAVGGLAYTVDSDIVFASGRYAPATSVGRRLLAHELTHVLQPRTATEVSGPLGGGVTAGPRLANALLLRQPAAKGAPSPLSGGLMPRPIELFVEADRKKIAAETVMEIGTAFTAFTDACSANIASLKAAAKAKAEFAALLIDLATGFLAPAFASWQAGKLMGRLSQKVSASMQVDNGEKIQELIAKADILKAAFTGVTKTAGDQIKRRSQLIFGEIAEELILDELKNAFQTQAVDLAGQIPGMVDRQADAELLSLWHAYDPDYTNVSIYKERVKHLLDEFARFVKSIGKVKVPAVPSQGGGQTFRTRVYHVDAFGKQRVMLVHEHVDESTFGRESRRFGAWVPKEWEGFAIEQTKEVFGDVTTIALADVDGIIPDPGP